MGKVGNSNVVVMTTGGNDCGFGVIVDKCIYHSNPARNYGPAYADDYDQTGDCALGLNKASDYIADTLQEDLIKTINDILIDPNVKSNPGFLLYLTLSHGLRSIFWQTITRGATTRHGTLRGSRLHLI